MKRVICIVLMWAAVCFGAETDGKFAIILQSGNETNEGAARAQHALLYAAELLEAGYAVALIFDGAGTGWANEFAQPESSLYEKYMKLKKMDLVEVVCDDCAEDLHVKEKLPPAQKLLLSGAYKGHPSIVTWVKKGYQIICL
ncbi:DsrE family protein [Pontiellaceae bacterium B12227]|nr:DsrE family protein [Pontiellaceae bacterium B12227]